MEAASLTCSLGIEELSGTGNLLKKSQFRSLELILGRNELREVLLKINFNGKKENKYILRELVIHKKFVKDGKATIKLPDHKVNLMLSNCPPDKLSIFLRTMNTKLECLRKSGFIGARKKFLSELPRSFQEISPMTIKDIETIHADRMKVAEGITPNYKRKRSDPDYMDKENQYPGKSKMARKCLSMVPKVMVNPVKLSKEQTMVLKAVIGGQNVFFTGSAGTGKSFLLKRIIGALPPQHTFATASTGVAACHIGGTTLHQFAGIGSGRASIEQCIELASRPQVLQQWKKCRHLIIDEISMVDGDFFEKLETVARVVRQSDQAFGGIQLIISGDFLQLPPVTKGDEKKKFCFQTKAWFNTIQVNMELTEVRRQSDKNFISILQSIRNGKCPEHMQHTLMETVKHNIHKNGILPTRLCTHKEDVDQLNVYHLQKLTGTKKIYPCADSDPIYAKQVNAQCPVVEKLELRVGAQVILAKNLDVQRGLVNGARGVVTGFEFNNEGQCWGIFKGLIYSKLPEEEELKSLDANRVIRHIAYPVVKFICGVQETIKPARWTIKVATAVHVTRKQIPLKLAWAISIHKSQGMSLDCVEISLSRVFEAGQAYVALSRAKSLDGLRVLDFDRKCVRANPEVLRFYYKLQLSQRMMQINSEDFS